MLPDAFPLREPTIECPECHDRVARSGAEAHAATHWPAYIHPYPEHLLAIERQKQLRDFGSSGLR